MRASTDEPAGNDVVILQKHVPECNRRITDKYWIGVFIVVFNIWIASWEILARHKNTEAINIRLESIDNTTAHKIYANNSTSSIDETSGFVSSYWGKCWIIDTIALNVGFLNANYERVGSIVVYTNVVFGIVLILYGLASMRSDHIYCKQMLYIVRPLGCFLLYYRFLMYLPNHWEMMKIIPFDKRILFWLIPELILLMIWSTKNSPNQDHHTRRGYVSAKINFNTFMGYVGIVGVLLVVSIESLILQTTAHIYKLGWDNPLFYLIAGGSFYIGLTFFYLGLMTIACATGISFKRQATTFKDLLRGFLIVGRYHFGTACYHATLIFPRLHATFVANKSEFRMIPKSSVFRRLYLTHCKIYNTLPMSTALRGNSHSASIRDLLWIFHSDSPKVTQFQSFSVIYRSFFALIIGINNLMLTLLWINGAIYEPRFMMGTWVMYLVALFLNYIFMRAHDAAADTLWLHVKQVKEVNF